MNSTPPGQVPALGFLVQCGGVQRRRVDVEPAAGMDEVSDQQAQPECAGRRGGEPEQGLAADPAERLHAADLGDAGDDHQEDQWCHHHLDQLDEALAQRRQMMREPREQQTSGDTQGDADEHLDEQ